MGAVGCADELSDLRGENRFVNVRKVPGSILRVGAGRTMGKGCISFEV